MHRHPTNYAIQPEKRCHEGVGVGVRLPFRWHRQVDDPLELSIGMECPKLVTVGDIEEALLINHRGARRSTAIEIHGFFPWRCSPELSSVFIERNQVRRALRSTYRLIDRPVQTNHRRGNDLEPVQRRPLSLHVICHDRVRHVVVVSRSRVGRSPNRIGIAQGSVINPARTTIAWLACISRGVCLAGAFRNGLTGAFRSRGRGAACCYRQGREEYSVERGSYHTILKGVA